MLLKNRLFLIDGEGEEVGADELSILGNE